MNYLDKLKKAAEEKREREQTTVQRQAQQEKDFSKRVKPALQHLHRYLYDLIQHLKYLKPEITVSFMLTGYGKVDNFRQSEYRIHYLAEEIKGDFVVRCTCIAPFKFRFEKRQERDAQEQRKYLQNHGITFHYVEIPDSRYRFSKALFEVEPIIHADFLFEGDMQNGAINLTVKNFNALGQCHYLIKPEEVNEPFLDNLAKYIVREPNNLVLHERYYLPSEYREKLEEIKKEKDYEAFEEWLNVMNESLEEELDKRKKRKLFDFFRRDKK
ncbi:MAG: hypothetical protein BWK79_07415 [Beggiatoa sp. IS2]|nr:MAG: hypothetical protein BWK79_07415 [Beggiatoa sp. IS2]